MDNRNAITNYISSILNKHGKVVARYGTEASWTGVLRIHTGSKNQYDDSPNWVGSIMSSKNILFVIIPDDENHYPFEIDDPEFDPDDIVMFFLIYSLHIYGS